MTWILYHVTLKNHIYREDTLGTFGIQNDFFFFFFLKKLEWVLLRIKDVGIEWSFIFFCLVTTLHIKNEILHRNMEPYKGILRIPHLMRRWYNHVDLSNDSLQDIIITIT
jgi:hypothetical protein